MRSTDRFNALKIPVNYVAIHKKIVGLEGLSARVIQAGIDPTIVKQPDGKISALQFKQFLELSLEMYSGVEPLSIAIASNLDFSSHGLLGFSALSARNLAEVLTLLSEYTKIIMPIVEFDLGEEGVDTHLSCFVDPNLGLAKALMTEISLMIAPPLFGYLSEKVTLKKVMFEHHQQSDLDHYETYFDCKVEFGQPKSAIVLESSQKSITMRHWNPEAAKALKAQLQGTKSECSNENIWSDLVSDRLILQLSNGESYSRDSIASLLHLSPRTLARRLEKEGTNYLNLLDLVRKEAALNAVTNSRQSITEIANDLGFSDPQVFARSFKRWTGTTATDFRRIKREIK